MGHIAVSGVIVLVAIVCYSAYRYPRGYRSVYGPLISLTTMILAAGVAWDAASYYTFKETLPFIRDVYIPDAFSSADEMRFGFVRLTVAYLMVVMWLTVLRLLDVVIPLPSSSSAKPEGQLVLTALAAKGKQGKR